MLAFLSLLPGIIERGLLFALPACSVLLTSRTIKFDDLTMEGSFGLGGAVTALCLVNNVPLSITLILVIIAGCLAGLATGLLHTKFRLNALMSGIVVTTGLFSINLKLGSSNMALHKAHTLFSLLPNYSHLVLLVPIAALVTGGLYWLLTTEAGYLLRATGANPAMLTTIGKDNKRLTIIGLVLANAVTAFTGSLFVQHVGYFSIWSNVGILILALASLMLGEAIAKIVGLNALVGSIIYQAIIAITFELNLDQDWNKLITALLIVALLAIQRRKSC